MTQIFLKIVFDSFSKQLFNELMMLNRHFIIIFTMALDALDVDTCREVDIKIKEEGRSLKNMQNLFKIHRSKPLL